MRNRDDPTMNTHHKNIQTEIDAAYLYRQCANHEADIRVAAIFRELADIEDGHAVAMARKDPNFHMPPPSWRARLLNQIGKRFGYHYVTGVLMDLEKNIAGAIVQEKRKLGEPIRGTEDNHVRILQAILSSQDSHGAELITRFEKRHKSVGGNVLRAAVLGGNDGLISNFSLVMGVAGATAGGKETLLAGVAGLLAGAFSMAMGEWISVTSSKELYENQMALEKEELEANPEGEQKELALIYQGKGMSREEAEKLAHQVIQDPEHAHEILIREELGINPEELEGSAWKAAIYSFILFSVGAMFPLFPFIFMTGMQAILWSVGLSIIGLFLIGAGITLFTGKNIWVSGFRQIAFGLCAAGITYVIGHWLGVSIS